MKGAYSGRQRLCTVDFKERRVHRVCVQELTGAALGMIGKTQEVTGKDMEFSYGFQSHFSFIAKHNDLRFVRE